MKICIAQTKPVKGDIESNIRNHKKLIMLAIANGGEIIIFPELSLTGYEPALAKVLAVDKEDSRLDDFQKISDSGKIIIGVGAPVKNDNGIFISMVLFRPNKSRQIYSKQYLHADEEPFFVCGQNSDGLTGSKNNISLAICYELSVPKHSENAFKNGAEVYIASVAKTVDGVEKASKRLSDIARKYSMIVLMSNFIGRCDDFKCGGHSSVWNDKGLLIDQMNVSEEGILIIDTESQQIKKDIIS